MKAGRLIPGPPQSAMNDAVLGEFGWCTMEERREIGKLKYFHRLRILPDKRLVKQIFIHTMKEAIEQSEKKKGSWCNDMFNIMNKYGIASVEVCPLSASPAPLSSSVPYSCSPLHTHTPVAV